MLNFVSIFSKYEIGSNALLIAYDFLSLKIFSLNCIH